MLHLTTTDDQLLIDEGETYIRHLNVTKLPHPNAPFTRVVLGMDFGSLIKPNPFRDDFKFSTQDVDLKIEPDSKNQKLHIDTKAPKANIPENHSCSSVSDLGSVANVEKLGNKAKQLSCDDKEMGFKSKNHRGRRSEIESASIARNKEDLRSKSAKKIPESASVDTFQKVYPLGILRLGERSRFSRDFEDSSGSRNSLDSAKRERSTNHNGSPLKPSSFVPK